MMVTDAWCSAAHKQEQHQGQHGDFRVVVFSYKSCEQPSTVAHPARAYKEITTEVNHGFFHPSL
jgi:hypothetical protein